MKIPMYVVATELKHGTKTVFNYGNTGQAVRASASIPSMFVPTKIGKSEYVDGGLVSPVPVEVARDLEPMSLLLSIFWLNPFIRKPQMYGVSLTRILILCKDVWLPKNFNMQM